MTELSYHETKPHFSLPAILAIICAIISFFVGAGAGMILAIIAIALGLIGFLMAFAPNVRGGVVSVVSVLAGAIAIIVAIIRLVVHHV